MQRVGIQDFEVKRSVVSVVIGTSDENKPS